MKIGVLITYFGKLPDYVRIFFWSAARNQNIDFIIVTDAGNRIPAPPNVRYERMTLDAFNELARRKLQLKISVPPGHTYKLCDLKPAYGLIFSELLSGYDFFGFGDLDLMLGDTRAFLTPEYLASYDLISMRQEYVSGSMTLLRNEERLINLFRASKDHARVFETPREHFSFDEAGHNIMPFMNDWRDVLTLPRQVEAFSYIVARELEAGTLRVDFTTKVVEKMPPERVLRFADGKLIELSPDPGREYMYYHWVDDKHKLHFRFPCDRDLQSGTPFYITPCGFFTEPEYQKKGWISFQRRASGMARKYLKYYPRRALAKVKAKVGNSGH